MVLTSLLLVLSAQADAPVLVAVRPRLAQAAPPVAPEASPLTDARRLAEQLRYEEAMVEYQRYLGLPQRPAPERAQALLELGFLHLLLGDEVSAFARSAQALEQNPQLTLPSSAPAKLKAFLAQSQQQLASRVILELSPRAEQDAPESVRARLVDPQRVTKRVQLRHALAPTGPYYATPMRCEGARCQGRIPPPAGAKDFTVWYFAEALDEQGNTVAQAAGPTEPRQLAVIGATAWYERPWVWAAGGAVVVAAASVVYLMAPPLPAAVNR